MTAPDPKVDRRILRTRKLLWEALISLIEEKDYSEITIQDIADRANVNRVTFYLHYRDKQDLLVKSVEVIFDELVAETAPLTGEAFRLDVAPEGMTLVYRHIAENARFYRKLLGENGIPAAGGPLAQIPGGTDHPAFPAGNRSGQAGPCSAGSGGRICRRLDHRADHLVAGK